MPSSDVVVSVRNLTKTYRIFGHPGDRLKQAMALGIRRYHREFTALRNVSFNIMRGETVGIIGRNGSGKSTILQVICGILKPTEGKVQVSGRISALLELGAGFNPEFTGRENAYFQGALMGLSKQDMDQRFPSIASFADIGDFVDQPVRIYSTGMYVRLAFSVAVHVNPDILVVDEALSVGDQVFQHRSKKRVQEVIDAGATLLLVSHDRDLVSSTCSRCLLLDQGHLAMDGIPSDVFDYYHSLIAAKGNDNLTNRRLSSGRVQITSGTGEAKVVRIRLLDPHGVEAKVSETGSALVLEFLVQAYNPIPRLVLAFSIRDRLGTLVFSTDTSYFGKSQMAVQRGEDLLFQFKLQANIGPGTYSVSTFLVSTNDRFTDNFETRELAYFFEIHNIAITPFAGIAWLAPTVEIQRTSSQ